MNVRYCHLVLFLAVAAPAYAHAGPPVTAADVFLVILPDTLLPADVQPGDTVRVGRADRVPQKSPGVALGLSVGGTVAGVAFPLLLFVGPSLGHFYTHSPQAWIGIGLRSVGSGIVLVGALSAWGAQDPTGPSLVIGAGVVLFVGSAVYDIVTAYGAAERYNERQEERARLRLSVAPFHASGFTGAQVAVRF